MEGSATSHTYWLHLLFEGVALSSPPVSSFLLLQQDLHVCDWLISLLCQTVNQKHKDHLTLLTFVSSVPATVAGL